MYLTNDPVQLNRRSGAMFEVNNNNCSLAHLSPENYRNFSQQTLVEHGY